MITFKKSDNDVNIEYSSGDTFGFGVSPDEVLEEGTTLRFQISPKGNSDYIIIENFYEISNGEFAVTLNEDELECLKEGRIYQYRLTIFDISGNITTTISGNLIVKWGA